MNRFCLLDWPTEGFACFFIFQDSHDWWIERKKKIGPAAGYYRPALESASPILSPFSFYHFFIFFFVRSSFLIIFSSFPTITSLFLFLLFILPLSFSFCFLFLLLLSSHFVLWPITKILIFMIRKFTGPMSTVQDRDSIGHRLIKMIGVK